MELPRHGLGVVAAISFLCLSLLPPAAVTGSVPGLFEALNLYGASEFAAALQANPRLLDAAISGKFGTVFAPIDSSFSNSSQYPSRVPFEPKDQLDQWYQDTISPRSWSNLTHPPDPVVVETIDPRANLRGSNQSIVLNVTRIAPSNTSSLSSRRYGDPQWTSYAEISTGLGDIVHVINPNLEFSNCGPTNGVLHIIDKYFTVPQLLSDTAAQLPELSIFTELLNNSCSCLKARLDSTAAITMFIPNNEAFAEAGITGSDKQVQPLLEGLVVPDFLGYTPTLAAEQGQFTTWNGSSLDIYMEEKVGPNNEQRQEFCVNNAGVVKPNIMLYNGVAHVIDRLPSARSS